MNRPSESASPLAHVFGCFAFFGLCLAMLLRSNGHPMIVVIAGFGLVVSLCALLGALWGRMRSGATIGLFTAMALLVTTAILACSGVFNVAR